MSKWPLKFKVDTFNGYWDSDQFGNDEWVETDRFTVNVFAYSVVRSEIVTREGQRRLVDDLQIHGLPNSFPHAESRIILDDGTEWFLQGSAEDHNNNPYWAPGLVTYHAERVQ